MGSDPNHFLRGAFFFTEDALREWCREQFAAYKYPRLIELRSELPTSATGKILKRELRVQ